jgi:hypothetical protein
VTVTVAGGYRAGPDPLPAIARMANAAHVVRSRTPAKWSLKISLLERLAEHLEDVPPALRAV